MATTRIEAGASEAGKPRRHWWRWLLGGLLALAVGGWFARFWLGERLADALRAELASRGVHVSWDSAAFLPGTGISFKALRLHRDAGHTESLTRWDKVTIRRGPTGRTSLHLQASGSELVLGEGEESLRMTDLAMDRNADREGVAVEQWGGLAHGLRVEVAGAVRFSKLESLWETDPESQEMPPVPPVPASKGLEGTDLAFLRTVGEWMKARQLGDKEVGLAVKIEEREAAPGYLVRADLDGNALVLKKTNVGVWGGQVQAAGIQADLKTSEWIVTGGQIEHIQLPQVNLSLGWKNGPTGLVDGTWQGSGGRTLERVRAQGSVRIAGAAFPFPSLGGLRQSSGVNQRIAFKQLQSGFVFHDQNLLLQAMAGSLWGGRMQIDNATVNVNDSTWQVDGARLEEIQIPPLRRSLGLPDNHQQGVFHGSWRGGGGLKLTSLRGHGSLKVTDEGFNKLPLLGPMALVFVGLAPGFVEETTSRLDTNYVLHGGTLTLSDLKVDSAVTEIQAHGDLNLVTQQAKLTARAKLRGIAGLPTGLLGRLLTLDGEGPFADIKWHLRYALGLEQVVGAAGTVGNTILSGGEAGVEAAAGVVKGVGKVAEGILGFPGRLRKKEDK